MENKIIIPLDLDGKEASELSKTLYPKICRLKVGNQLFTSSGPKIVKEFQQQGFDIFLDLKFHDIPNTVHEAVKSAADLGVWMVNVHAAGGRKMLEASRKALEDYSNPPLLIGVTVLTSFSEDSLLDIGLSNLSEQVIRLTRLDDQSRVSTPLEAIRNGSDYLVIGRPITGSSEPKKALEEIYKEIS